MLVEVLFWNARKANITPLTRIKNKENAGQFSRSISPLDNRSLNCPANYLQTFYKQFTEQLTISMLLKAVSNSWFSAEPTKRIRLKSKFKTSTKVNTFKKMIHEQLPLPVPCYDLAPLTESSLGPLAWNFGYPQLAWLDGRLSS